jgi:hypothetical protein
MQLTAAMPVSGNSRGALGIMKTVAGGPAPEIELLAKSVLEKEQIAFQTRFAREWRGEVLLDLLVSDEDYKRASAAIKKWRSEGHCPGCNSQSWGEVKDSLLAKRYALRQFECVACGHLLLTLLPPGEHQ